MSERTPGGRRWQAARGIEAWAGEVRVNLIRMAAVIAFYANHLVRYYFTGDIDGGFHASVTALTMVWIAQIMTLHFALSRRWVPTGLKYAATGVDIGLVTGLVIVGGGAGSPLAILYFLVVAAAPLRLSLALVYVATLGSMAGYALVLGVSRWGDLPDVTTIARQHQIIFLLGIGAAGLFAGQTVRQTRRVTSSAGVVVLDGPAAGAGDDPDREPRAPESTASESAANADARDGNGDEKTEEDAS